MLTLFLNFQNDEVRRQFGPVGHGFADCGGTGIRLGTLSWSQPKTRVRPKCRKLVINYHTGSND